MTEAYGDLVETISNVRFTPVRLRHEGYEMSAVDALLDDIIAALGRGEPVTRLLDDVRLPHVRWREGYDLAEVDQFLESLRLSVQSRG